MSFLRGFQLSGQDRDLLMTHGLGGCVQLLSHIRELEPQQWEAARLAQLMAYPCGTGIPFIVEQHCPDTPGAWRTGCLLALTPPPPNSGHSVAHLLSSLYS